VKEDEGEALDESCSKAKNESLGSKLMKSSKKFMPEIREEARASDNGEKELLSNRESMI